MRGNTQIVEYFWLARPSTRVAPDLLGCSLVPQFPDGETIPAMVETEAYGPEDPACHANEQRTPRNQAMFGPGGFSHVPEKKRSPLASIAWETV